VNSESAPDGRTPPEGRAVRTDGGESRADGGTDSYTHVPEGMADPAETGPDEGMGNRGWVLVGIVAFATVVCPAVVYFYPSLLADHVSFRFAMLAVPFLPALLLGGTAVWAMASRND
jgi:hypothetical protein